MTTSSTLHATSSFSRSFVESLLIMIATTIIAVAVLQAEPLQSANDRSRWATVWSLVERGTWQIDEIDSWPHWSTIDKVRYRKSEREPWHFYSSKPPFLSTIVAGLYAAERSILGFGLFNHTALVTRLLLLIVNVLPFCITLLSLQRTLQRLETSLNTRCFLLLTAGFASILNPYLTTLNNHTPAVASAMLTLSAAIRLRLSPRRRDFAVLGFFAAMTCCFELPAAQLGVAAFIFTAAISPALTLWWFIPAASVPLLFFFATNWAATGGVKPFYATYGTETYVYVHNGIPSYWSSPHDLDANTETPLVYLFHCILGHHGLLSLTPVLLLALAGPFLLRRFINAQRTDLGSESSHDTTAVSAEPRTAAAFIIATGALMTLITLGFYLTRTENYNYGGNSVGLRWMLWLTPFWWIAMVPVLESSGKRMLTTAAILLALSTGTVSWSLNRPWKPAWLFEQMEAAGWINYRTPRPPFDPPRFSVLPKVPESGISETFVNSRGDRVTLTATESAERGTPSVTATQVVINSRQILPSDFAPNGMPLVSPGLPPASQQTSGLTTDQKRTEHLLQRIFGSIRSGRPFAFGGSTWTPSVADPENAWEVQRGAIRVAVNDPTFGNCIERVDVLFCEKRPFGTLQWKITLTDAETGETLHAETWICEGH